MCSKTEAEFHASKSAGWPFKTGIGTQCYLNKLTAVAGMHPTRAADGYLIIISISLNHGFQ